MSPRSEHASLALACALSLGLGCGQSSSPASPPAAPSPAVAEPGGGPSTPPVAAPEAPAASPPASPPSAGQPTAEELPPAQWRSVVTLGRPGTLYVMLGGSEGTTTGDATELQDGYSSRHLRHAGRYAGTPVRLLGNHGTCEGHLGTPVQLEHESDADDPERGRAAPVEGCSLHEATVAVLNPSGPNLTNGDLEGELARAARQAARGAARRRPHGEFLPDRVVRGAGGSVWALAVQMACDEGECDEDEREPWPAGIGLAVARPGAEPEVKLRRRAHFPFEGDQLYDAYFSVVGLMDGDGDGVPEVVEEAGYQGGRMVRVVEPSSERAGTVVVRMSWDALDSISATVRPLTPFARHDGAASAGE